MKKLMLLLMLIMLGLGCSLQRIKCEYPPFPLPPPNAAYLLDELGKVDPAVWAWNNKMLDLCQKLGTCSSGEK